MRRVAPKSHPGDRRFESGWDAGLDELQTLIDLFALQQEESTGAGNHRDNPVAALNLEGAPRGLVHR